MTPMHVNRELRLYSFVSDFVSGYHGLTKLIDTQFPFPLAQMTRTFVFIWVYSLPWVLYNDEMKTPSLIMIVFFITYGKNFYVVAAVAAAVVFAVLFLFWGMPHIQYDFHLLTHTLSLSSILAFVGLECVSIELDDPYGNDVSDSPGCCRPFLIYARITMLSVVNHSLLIVRSFLRALLSGE
jgi:predicted membrane chloride channel (bestrophin family)